MKPDTGRKELEYYLNLQYPVTVHADTEGGFVAEIEELRGCMTQAEKLDEVFQAIDDARKLWIKSAYEEGQDIPLPRNMVEHTGKFLLRIPRSLHRDLARIAKMEGVSLNQYVTSLLASGVGRDFNRTRVSFIARTFIGGASARVWGTREKAINYGQLLKTTQSKAMKRE